MGLERFKASTMTRQYKFVGEEIKISKLTLSAVLEIQALSTKLQNNKDNNEAGLELMFTVIRNGVEEFKAATDDDFKMLPMDELSKLSDEILKFSGLGKTEK